MFRAISSVRLFKKIKDDYQVKIITNYCVLFYLSFCLAFILSHLIFFLSYLLTQSPIKTQIWYLYL